MRLELGATPLHYCRVLHQNKTEGNLAYPGVQNTLFLGFRVQAYCAPHPVQLPLGKWGTKWGIFHLQMGRF